MIFVECVMAFVQNLNKKLKDVEISIPIVYGNLHFGLARKQASKYNYC